MTAQNTPSGESSGQNTRILDGRPQSRPTACRREPGSPRYPLCENHEGHQSAIECAVCNAEIEVERWASGVFISKVCKCGWETTIRLKGDPLGALAGVLPVAK